jgi:HK97 family phage prohead protease
MLETREFEMRTNEDSRTVSGIAVPYNQVTDLGYIREQFAPDSVTPADNVMLFWRHEEPIGKIIESRSTDAGWEITAHISETPRGNEAYTLLRDGVINKFSIGFEPVDANVNKETNTITRTNVVVREVSLVPMPAYAGATIQEVREHQEQSEETITMTENAVTLSDLAEVRESIEVLERNISTIASTPRETEPVMDTRSAGEILKAIAQGDEATIRAYTGGTSADAVVRNGYVGDLTRFVQDAQILGRVFSTGTLPSEGNYVEYAQLKSNTIPFAVQSAEGDDLTGGKIAQELKTAAVKTYGGYARLTRQEIERSSVNILDATLRAQAAAAGKTMATVFRSDYETEVTAQVTATNTVAAANTWAGWVSAAIDAAGKFLDLGLSLDALVVSKATFKLITALQGSDGRGVFLASGAGVNNLGTLNVAGLTGSLANIPVVVDPALAANKSAFVNSQALRSYGSGLVSLQQDNIINLSRDFSVYTYMAVAHEIPAAIVPVTGAGQA